MDNSNLRIAIQVRPFLTDKILEISEFRSTNAGMAMAQSPVRIVSLNVNLNNFCSGAVRLRSRWRIGQNYLITLRQNERTARVRFMLPEITLSASCRILSYVITTPHYFSTERIGITPLTTSPAP